ncbi:MAG: hypothetical protein CO119_04550 [Flavobacteriales bacterium CG_4_9_14_3_um_filter_40_17]|nr:MAG: hypothetical protein CO119_04550 [Flavobacteriales bacterium CG_4_9_14_3_um_filter_40_17]
MKKIPILLLLMAISFQVFAQKKTDKKADIVVQKQDTIRIANDSLEYEIIIIEVGFDSWLVTQRPKEFFSESFLETRNRFYVQTYNQRVLEPQRYDPNLYFQQINYEPNIHYGLDVNYLLYMYFEYFQKKYKQNLRYY